VNNTLKTLIDVMPTGVTVADADGSIVLTNAAANTILRGKVTGNAYVYESGYTLHRPDGSLLAPHEVPLPISISKGEAVKDMEIVARFEEGEEIVIMVSSSPIYEKTGTIVGAVAVFQDITFRKASEEKLREDEETLRAFFNAIAETMVLTDVKGTVLAINDTGAKRFDRKAEEIIGQEMYSLMPPELARERKAQVDRLIQTGKPVRFEDRRSDFYLDNSIYPIFDTHGNVTKLATFSQDISKRKAMEQALNESEDRFEIAFDNAAVGMALVSVEGRFLKVNRSLCEIVGYSEEELLSITFQSITHPDDLDENLKYMEKLLTGEMRNYHMEKKYIHKTGQIVWIMLSVALIRDAHGSSMYFIAQIQDITKRKEVEEELRSAKQEAERAREKAERLASTDYLTGILNRRAFMDRLNEEFERMKREKTSIGLIIADIDHFKRINDTYGHQVGDMALQKFVQCLLGVCRHYDIIGRYGGEEFIVCLPNTAREQSERIAERMRTAVQNLQINLVYSLEPIRITSSFGVAAAQCNYQKSIDSLVGEADVALYRAKISGRNKVCTTWDI